VAASNTTTAAKYEVGCSGNGGDPE